jgi:hypothetical protein
MSRGLTPDALSATAAEVVDRTAAVELDFPSGIVRYTGAPYPISIRGNEFLGVGVLGSISVAEESAELQSYGMTLTLSGIPRDSVAVALTQAYQGRRATVWEVPLNPATGKPVDAPIVIFRGRMDQMNVELGTEGKVVLKLENRLADWERPRIRRYTNEDQQRVHPGDKGFAYVSATAEKELVWPTKAAFE